jgi:hypothetical protein
MNKSKTERWNTLRVAMIGAVFGIVYSSFDSQLWELQLGEILASLIGAAIGGAALFAIVSRSQKGVIPYVAI